MINNKLAQIKTKNEVLDAGSTLGKELIYSMKVNYWMHDDPQRVQITKIRPMYKGTREQVFNRAKRPIQEMWIESDCLFGDVLGPTSGLDPQLPRLVRTGRGRSSTIDKD